MVIGASKQIKPVRDLSKPTQPLATSSVTQRPTEIGRSSTLDPLRGGGTDDPSGPPDPPKHRRWLWLLLLVIVIVAGVIAVRQYMSHVQAASAKQPRNPPATQVVAVTAHQGDIPVYLTGLGAVTPIYTVTVKTRVDGQIMEVNYHEGQEIAKGQPLVEIDPRPYQVQLTQAEGQLTRDKALLDNARTDLQRYQTLIKKNAVAEQIYATQVSTVAQDEGNVKTDEGNIASARLNIAYCHITSPISGRVGLRLVDPGNLVQSAGATPLVVITQMQPISVIFTLGEDQLQPVLTRVRAGQHLKVDALDRDSKVVIAHGELTTLDNEIDQTTGTLKMRATFPNKDNTLFPNQFVNAQLLVEEKKKVTLVSNAAIQRNGTSTFIYVAQPDNTVNVRMVKLGTTGTDESEVLSGINPGEIAITQGVDKLQEGSKVQAFVQQPGDQNPAQAAGSAAQGSNSNAGGNTGHHGKRASNSTPSGNANP